MKRTSCLVASKLRDVASMRRAIQAGVTCAKLSPDPLVLMSLAGLPIGSRSLTHKA